MTRHPIQQDRNLVVTGATNAIPVVITTSAVHGLTTGDTVDIDGLEGNYAPNGNGRAVTVVTTTTFSLAGVKGSGIWIPGTGRVFIQSQDARLYDADTAYTGDVFPSRGWQVDLIIDATQDPTGVNQGCDVSLLGRADTNSDWSLIRMIDEDTSGWAQVGSGRYVIRVLNLNAFPEMRLDVNVTASSTNTIRAWAVPS